MKRILVAAVLLAVAGVPGLAASPVAAETSVAPPSLQGEVFVATEVDFSTSCTPDPGTTSTVTYHASGVALGPYPGTFTETGTVKSLLTGPFPNLTGGALGTPTSWTVKFTIDSPVGQVSGTKTLAAEPPKEADCIRAGGSGQGLGLPFLDEDQADALLDYQAAIVTSTGAFRDQGRAQAYVLQVCGGTSPHDCSLLDIDDAGETFYLSSGVLPLDTTGKATGGGQLGDPLRGAGVSFGFEVKQPELGKLQGRCLVNDSASNTRVKCLDVTSYSQIGNTATWTGHGEVNGALEDYRITVQDNGEPNQGLDTFAFHSDSYDVAGNVQNGNVQLHKQTTP